MQARNKNKIYNLTDLDVPEAVVFESDVAILQRLELLSTFGCGLTLPEDRFPDLELAFPAIV